MSDLLNGATLAEVRRELALLVAMADSAERPKPTVINSPGHPMAGYEWRVDQHVLPGRRSPMWIVRTVDDPETSDAVYVAEPDPYSAYDYEASLDFTSMSPVDARRLAMALLAAADRAEHLTAGVTRLEDRRPA
jgi:hypothetical protein